MGKKILVVDDDLGIIEALKVALENEELYDITTTTKGEDVRELINKKRPDLILLDVLLSGVDGRDICKELKRGDGTKKIPIIMISAHPTAERSARECGADEFIPKPFDIDTLLDTVKKLAFKN